MSYNGQRTVHKGTSFQAASCDVVSRATRELVRLGERFRAVFLELALTSESKIDLKYCVLWESGPIHSKHIWQ